jgi:acyltransferase
MQTHSSVQSKKRIHWIDICRGIAIILVMYGHLFASDKSRYFIYSFHMPLFFFISGLVFKPVMDKSFLSITYKYIKQLLIPYFIFAIFTYLFALVSQSAGDVSIGGITYQIFGVLYGNGNNGMLGYNVVLWFLPCLFITKLSFAAITKNVLSSKKIMILLIASAVFGSFLATTLPWLKLPFSLEVALTGLPFLGAGYLFRIDKNLFYGFEKYKLLIAPFALFFTAIIAGLNFHMSGLQVDLRVNQLNNIPLFYLGAFGGIISWMAVSQIISKNIFLEYIGKHSLVIFVWHNILLADLENIVNALFSQGMIHVIKPFMSTIYVFVALNIILFCRMLVMKFKVSYRFIPFIKA